MIKKLITQVSIIVLLSLVTTIPSLAATEHRNTDDKSILREYDEGNEGTSNEKSQYLTESKSSLQENDINNYLNNILMTKSVVPVLPSSPQNALDITNDYPSYIGYNYMNSGNAGYMKFTAPYSGIYSLFTYSILDTYIEIYDSVDLSNRVEFDDDSGHGLNAMDHFFIESGETYYFKLRGYNKSQTGYFIVKFNRGLVTSLGEENSNFSIFNSNDYQAFTNCYCYALNYWTNPITGDLFRPNGQNPGEMSGNPIRLDDLANADIAYDKIYAASKLDAEVYGGDIKPIERWEQPDKGYYKVSLVLDPGNDYHWYRQMSNGRFAHKPGQWNARWHDGAYNDTSGYYIYYPEPDYSNTDIYTEHLGYFQVKTPAGKTNTNLVVPSKERDKYKKKDISIDQIDLLRIGDTLESVYDILGKEHGYHGAGYVGYKYNLENDESVVIYFYKNRVEQIRRMDSSSNMIILKK